jgi:hypothetical protein
MKKVKWLKRGVYISTFAQTRAGRHIVRLKYVFLSHTGHLPILSFVWEGGRKTENTCSDAPRTFGVHTYRKSLIVFFEEEKYCEVAIFISLLLYRQRLQRTCRICTLIFESNLAEFITTLTGDFKEGEEEQERT